MSESKYERGRKRHKFIQVPVSVEEKKMFLNATEEDGHAWLSGWLRWLGINRAKKILRGGGHEKVDKV